ncbi:MAG: C13 family peptidase [Steroidobacteraceae bacterium]
MRRRGLSACRAAAVILAAMFAAVPATRAAAVAAPAAAHCPQPPGPARTRREAARARRLLLQEQQSCIAAAVARLAPRVPGTTNVFFVGFAGYGEQRVFRREAETARRVFAERFGSLDRSLELVNDIHDRSTYPLATFDNLRYALRLIGRRMNRDRDLLVLVLTSHGSPDDGIAITNGDLIDDALSPRDVRQVLNEAHVRWRVVIASACYAGIFIRPLETDTSLIMTAADSRHSSFGCADDRDLTYFGEALFADALPQACSLEDAFASARRIIRRRETAEGEIHSNPQIYVGSRMRAKLGRLALTRVSDSAGRGARCAFPPRPPPRGRGADRGVHR